MSVIQNINRRIADLLKYKRNGVFIELGGFEGILGSNSFFFERCLNWTGLVVEANPFSYSILVS